MATEETGQANFEEDPAAAFLQRETEELGDIGNEIFGPSTTQSDATGQDLAGDEFQMIGEEDDPAMTEDDRYAAINTEDVSMGEPECIRRWRQEQEERLAKKDAAEQEAIEDLRRQAGQDLEDMYRHMDEQLDQTKARNREGQEAFIRDRDADEPGHEWERVANMCDFSGKRALGSKDVSRMRSIFLHLKQEGLNR